MSSTQCNFKMTLISKSAVILALLVCISAPQAEARGKSGHVEREADCHRDKACLDEYDKKKSEWLSCLDAAGISEKKRKKLSAKVEAIGIHGLKRQEILTFNSKRKDCNSDFQKGLSEIHVNRSIEKDKGNSSSVVPPATPDPKEKKD